MEGCQQESPSSDQRPVVTQELMFEFQQLCVNSWADVEPLASQTELSSMELAGKLKMWPLNREKSQLYKISHYNFYLGISKTETYMTENLKWEFHSTNAEQ
jgi:hypothetical protein